ncbi:MAG: twin-arginine translocation signal domain-containing protein [Proteobacteria bacterium]|nr:twin-arginine translocation signal domain-containing protein [Pseudomonadota bacterium]
MAIDHRPKRAFSRRRFLKGTGVAVLGSAAGASVLSRRAYGAAWILPDDSPEIPSSHEIATIKKLADTILPNADGDPGGIECNAFDTINDLYYGVNPYISEVVSDVDDAAFWAHLFFKDFKKLDLDDRTEVLEERLGQAWWSPGSLYKDVYEGIIALTKLTFFGGLQNTVGTDYIGFPGPSSGYETNRAPASGQATARFNNWTDPGSR